MKQCFKKYFTISQTHLFTHRQLVNIVSKGKGFASYYFCPIFGNNLIAEITIVNL